MATRFATFTDWMANGAIIPLNDLAVVIPENYSEGQGVFKYKRGTGRLNFRQLPFEPTQSFFVITSVPTTVGDVSGPATSTIGNFATWADATGTTLADGPAPSDFATAAQGALADTALQPGDPLTDLSSGAATAGQVPESDGAGNITWVTPPAGGGDVVGPGASTDNAVVRWDGVTGALVQNSVVGITDAGAMTGLTTINGNSFPPSPGTLTTTATDLDQFSSGAATAGQVPEADGVGGVTWATPSGGDVVGPGTSTVGFIPTWDNTSGTLLATGLDTSTGGNESADSGKVAVFNLEGQLAASAINSVTAAFRATTSGTATAIEVANAGAGNGIDIASTSGLALAASTGDNTAADLDNDSTTAPTLEVTNDDATNAGPLAHFHDDAGLVLSIENDGTLDWSSATGAQGTVDNLPVFGALTKGVVPAAGAVPSATKFLDETGAWSVPPDTTGITQLTGDVTAGPGSGSQAATLANTAVTPASYTYTSLTVDAKGRLTAASNGTTPLLPANDLSDVSSAATARTNLEVVRQLRDTVGSGQTTTSTTLADITGLSLVVEASAHVSGTLRVLFENSLTTGGIGLGINGSAAATYFAGRFETTQSAGNFVQQITAFNATTNATTVPVANTVYYAEVNFELVNGGSSNTIVGQIARGGSGTLTIRAASLLIIG